MTPFTVLPSRKPDDEKPMSPMTTPTTTRVPVGRNASTALRSTAGTPVVSRPYWVPLPVISRTAAVTSVVVFALIVCVAPSSLASARRLSCRSTAMIVVQPAIFAAINPARPTAPAP